MLGVVAPGLFSDSDRLGLPSLAQGSSFLLTLKRSSRDRASVSQDRLVSTIQSIICAQMCWIVLVRESRIAQSWKPALSNIFRTYMAVLLVCDEDFIQHREVIPQIFQIHYDSLQLCDQDTFQKSPDVYAGNISLEHSPALLPTILALSNIHGKM